MTNPTRKQIIDILAPWVERHDAIEAAFLPLEGYLEIGNPLFESAWMTFDRYSDALGQLVGDQFKWLQWYASDNDMGVSRMEASPRKGLALRKIKNLSDLAWLIVESRV